jgi:exodeoxyribonuclease V beta subunit
MQRFDCLAAEAIVFGPHFLEASAGTGKTFAIEHIVARLILEGVDIEQILVVTFTRAAARELKLRIRSNLEKIIAGANWAYLPTNVKLIGEALASFDRCQIFTIHGFCSRMLKEFAFEAGLHMGLKEAKDPGVDTALRDFFELKLTAEIISPEQLNVLIRWAGSVEDLARKLKKGEMPEFSVSFAEIDSKFRDLLSSWNASLASLRSDFALIEGNYKKMDADFSLQIEALIRGDLRALISEKNSIFSYTALENKKVKAKDLPFPPFLDWGRQHLLPLIEQAQDPKELLNAVLSAWKPIQEKVLLDSGVLGPDELLKGMVAAIKIDSFKAKVQAKYRAVLIDEFQDTDPGQWAIFETLFLHTVESLFLIGDPKQSIYRFRKADLYTYLKAKHAIPPEGHFFLDTNFRSSKPLLDALNGLFDRQWLYLPQQKTTLPYLPVLAGLDIQTDFHDGKGSVHCVRLEKDEMYKYVAREILNLGKKPSAFAVLVKDRYQAFEMQKVLSEANIPSIARSQEPLSESLSFEAMRELFEALKVPRNLGKAKIVLAGPFCGFTSDELRLVDASPFTPLREMLDKQGLAAMCGLLLRSRFGTYSVEECLKAYGRSFYAQWLQLLEILFEWERTAGFSFEGVARFFDRLDKMDPDEAICSRKEINEDAVQIMTMHVSKGLEFDIVFALGVGSRTPECDEEAESEKQRQLYVAMTRAKRRLYVPIPFEEKSAKAGTLSPIELFCRSLSDQGLWEAELQRLSETTSLTLETVSAPIVYEPAPLPVKEARPTSNYSIPPFQNSYLLSFTSMAPETPAILLAPMEPFNGTYTAQNLPRGSETGVIIHRIYERYFSEVTSIRAIVEQELGALLPWKNVVIGLVEKSLSLPLSFGFSLNDVARDRIRVEVEFMFQAKPNYIKGFIDLLFVHEGKLYFVDWKTNWLDNYSTEKLEEAIALHRYDLQASIYKEAMKREWNGEVGGAIYLFIRGPAAICFQAKEGSWN